MSLFSSPLRSGVAASVVLVVVIACAQTSGLPMPDGAFAIQDQGLSEMSGLEASPTQPGVLWSINDSGSRPLLYRLGLQGENLGRVRVRGTNWWHNDWETLAIWREGMTDWLLIGDVGDNKQRRSHVNVYAVREPVAGETEAVVAWSIRFRYPDGPRDAEGIAVDARTGDLLVLTKREQPQRLYRIALAEGRDGAIATAELVATLPMLSAQATGLDVTKDGATMAVLTYKGLYLWDRTDGDSWASALATGKRRIQLPALSKAEAMAFGADPGIVYVGSERLPAPLLAIGIN